MTVAAVLPGGGTPTGTVTVGDGTNTCTVTLAGGSGSCNLPSSSVGSKTITAAYGGSTSFNTSSATTAAHTVSKANSTTSIVSAAPEPSVFGQSYSVSVSAAAASPGTGTPTGTVIVGDGSNTCTVTLSSGAGACNLPSSSVGSKTISAAYSGSTSFNSSTAATAAHTVSMSDTTTAISADLPDPSVTGQAYTVSFSVAAVSPGSGSPDGSVTVSDGSATCFGTLTGGSGSCSLASLSIGSKTLTATYSGSSNFNSSSGSAAHSVQTAATSLTIVDDPDPSEIGSSFSVTVTVNAAAPGGGTPTGTVSITDGTTTCTDVTLVSGSASCTLPDSTSPDPRPFDGTLSATYSGDDNYDAITTPQDETHTYVYLIPHLSITSTSPSPSVPGQGYTVNFSAVATHPKTSPIPSGAVKITDVNGATCTGTLVPDGADTESAIGTGSCLLTTTTAGSIQLKAAYPGDANFSSGKTTGAHTVDKGSTQTLISGISPASTVKTGQTYTVTASVSPTGAASGTPTGSILIDDGVGSTCTITLASGSGSCSMGTYAVGTEDTITLTATYQGDNNFKISATSAAHAITKADTKTSITSISREPSVNGENFDVSVKVTAVAPGSGTPVGTVTVGDGTHTCLVTLSGGSGACSLPGSDPGTLTISAAYGGDDNYQTSSAAGAPHEIDLAASSITITSSTPAGSVVGEDYSVYVSVDAVAPGVGVPGGTVAVSDGEGHTCMVTLSGGAGSCPLPSSAAKAITLAAAYFGNTHFDTASTTQAHTIDPAGTSTTITADSSDPTVAGESYPVAVSVAAVAPGHGTPGGNVLVDDGAQSCTATLSAGIGSCNLTSTTAGSKTLSATYGGSANFAPSSVSGETHTVNKALTSTTITADAPDPSEIGSLYPVSVSVAAVLPGSGTPEGSVTIVNGGSSCSAALSAGSGSCNLTSDVTGTRNISASYGGDDNFAVSANTESHQVVNLIATAAITAITPNISIAGEPYQVAFSLTHALGVPTGMVTVTDGSALPEGTCTGPLDAVGGGACLLISTTPGSKTITASYAGDGVFEPVSKTASHQVNKADSATTIVSDLPDPSYVGSAYSVSVSVAAAAPGSGVPGGKVTLDDGSGSHTCEVTLVNGSGSCSLPSDTAAERSLTAAYAGDSNFKASTSSAADHSIQKSLPTVTVTSTLVNPSVTGQAYPVNFSVTHPSAGTPTGSVTVSDGTGGSCSAALSSGSASCSLASTSVGSKILTASYGGDNSFSSVEGSTAQTVNPDTTLTTITSDSPDPAQTGEPYLVSVSVAAAAPGAGNPGGSVAVDDGEGNPCTLTLSAGSGSCSLATFTIGTKTLTAHYQGSSDFLASSDTAVHSAAIADTSTSITQDAPNPSAPGEGITLSAAVAPVSPAAGVPGGTVDFKEGSTVLCSAALAGGTASCAVAGLPGGGHTLSAVYSGSTEYKPSTSPGRTHAVESISLDDNQTSTSFSAVGHFSTNAGQAPYTYTLESSGRTCTGANGADNSSFSIGGVNLNTLQRSPATSAGTYSICVQSVDAGAGVVQAVFPVIINDPPSLSGTALDHHTVSVDQTDVGHLTSTGGRDPQAFSLKSSGTVCSTANSSGNTFFSIVGATLKLNPGTPAGSYPVCFQVKDAEGETAQQAVTVTVTAPPAAMTLSRNTVSTVQTNVGDFSLNNGQSPFTYTLTTSGLVCDATRGGNNSHFTISASTLQLSAGTAAGPYAICVQAEDANHQLTQQVFGITVTEPPADITLSKNMITTAQSIVGTLNTVKGQHLFTYSLQNSGSTCGPVNGVNNSQFQVEGNALERLPATLAGSYQVCLQTDDANNEIFQKSFTVVVSAAAPSPLPWTASLTSSNVIDGDQPGTLVGTAISSVPGTTFQLADLTAFPFESAFNLTASGSLTLAASVDINAQKYYPIRILATTPVGQTQYLDVVIVVMKNGKDAGSIAIDDSGNLGENGQVEVDVLSNDILSPGATSWASLQITRYPEHGSARIGSIIYTPSLDFIGSDFITYRACDNLGFCVVGELTLSVASNGGRIPETGFAPNRLTILPEQPADKLYSDMNEMSLVIPSLAIDAPIVGVPSTSTGWDLSWLGKDAGWLQGSAYPTWNGNSVLTGHVSNADGTPGIFVNLAKMHWGDTITVRLQGQSYLFEVRQVLENIKPGDLDKMMAHKDNPWLTLVTCQGYDSSSNTYLWRIMVRAVLVKVE